MRVRFACKIQSRMNWNGKIQIISHMDRIDSTMRVARKIRKQCYTRINELGRSRFFFSSEFFFVFFTYECIAHLGSVYIIQIQKQKQKPKQHQRPRLFGTVSLKIIWIFDHIQWFCFASWINIEYFDADSNGIRGQNIQQYLFII